ncbi:CD226 antigen-like [Pogoniulus pusillus]|uniref:CD226 antigen-like n=1 Tax=Pogoniulus pusillus TaxID=488313 RepID=UPI0030B984C2
MTGHIIHKLRDLKERCSEAGGGNEQQTDVISAWEGDSISIICSRGYLEEILGTYLRAGKEQLAVLYVPREGTPRTFAPLTDRLNYSEEGRTLRITLQNAQQSDSNIYQCSTYVLSKGHHKVLCEKKTIVVVKAQTRGVVKQSPLYASPQPGQSVTITCALKSSYEDFYLLKTHVQRERVLHVSSQNTSTTSLAFANRLEYSKEEQKVVITLHNLQENDSDIYVCAGMVKNVTFLSVSGSGTMMLIKGEKQVDCSNSSWVIYGLTITIALLLTAMMCCILGRVDMKRCFQKRNPHTILNTVYEDMSYASRRNTLNRTNTCSLSN